MLGSSSAMPARGLRQDPSPQERTQLTLSQGNEGGGAVKDLNFEEEGNRISICSGAPQGL